MKKAIVLLMIVLFFSPAADACVGKVLNIGVLNSPEGQVLSEMLSALITERTGTTVTVKYFRNEQDLYEAVRKEQVDISIENTSRALRMLNKPSESDARKAYETVKSVYEKEKGMIWLKPFGFLKANGGHPSYTATLLRVSVLTNFPALPRVINKLGSGINDDSYARLIRSVESGEKPKKVARDFLKSKKLI
jgi:glycine betaine/choline ABC-type transport system substrate-binding protein